MTARRQSQPSPQTVRAGESHQICGLGWLKLRRPWGPRSRIARGLNCAKRVERHIAAPACISLGTNKLDHAIVWTRRAVDGQKKRQSRAFCYLASLLISSSDLTAAAAATQSALALQPDHAVALRYLSDIKARTSLVGPAVLDVGRTGNVALPRASQLVMLRGRPHQKAISCQPSYALQRKIRMAHKAVDAERDGSEASITKAVAS
jgi:hypothetical protein